MSEHYHEEMAQALFEENSDALILFDPETERVLDANPVLLRLSGFSRAQLLHREIYWLFRPEGSGSLERFRQASRKTGSFHCQEGFLLRTQEEGVWIPVSLTLIRLHVKPRVLSLLTIHDVREEREAFTQMRTMEAELRRVLASVSDCLWSAEIDRSGQWTYRYFSPVVEKVTGHPAEYFFAGLQRWQNLVHPEDRSRWARALVRWRSGQSCQEEYRIVWPDQTVRWVRDSVQVSPGSEERAFHLDGVLTDITEPRLVQERLRESEKRFRDFFASSPDAIFVEDLQGNVLDANPAACRLHGLEPSSLVGRNVLELVPLDQRAHVAQVFARLAEGAIDQAEGVSRGADGQLIPVELKVSRIDYDGQPALLLHVRDITKRQRAEEALREREARLRLMVEQMPAALWTTDAELCITSSLGAALARINLKPNQLVGVSLYDYLGTRDPAFPPIAAHQRALRGEPSAYELDWQGRTFQVHLEPLRQASGKIVGCVGVALDISEHQRALAALRDSEQRYRSVVEGSIQGIAICQEGTIRYANPALARMFGYADPAELVGRDFWQTLVAPEEWPALQARGAACLQGKRLAPHPGWQGLRQDGSRIWVQSVASAISWQGQPAILAFYMDVTEQKQAEASLAREHAMLRGLLDAVPDLVFYKDRQGVFLGCNHAVEEYVGRSEKEIVGKTDRDFFPPELAAFYEGKDHAVMEEGRPRRNEEWLIYPDGRQVRCEMIKAPFFGPGGEVLGIIGVGRDITERKRLEEQLLQSQKLEAIGQLAGGVAHDFNNLLTIILGNVSLLLAETRNPTSRESLDAIEKASWRAADLTRQLLGFSRQAMLQLVPLDLNVSLRELVTSLRRSLDPRIALEFQEQPGLWNVRGDARQLQQVLLSLCLNARDAMPEGGRLTLDVANVAVEDDHVRDHVEARPGDFVCLRIRDTGHGIPADILPRIFDPFFTTKGTGKGKGLGLAMAFGVLKQHHGWIECLSEMGRGTCFSLYLPRLRGDSIVPRPPPTPSSSAARAERATILLVDDEDQIRALGKVILEQNGYEVLLAEDGIRALDVYQREKGRIDLVILDLTMPHMSGRDALRRLRQIDRRVRVLFSSGYSAEQVMDTPTDSVVGFVSKPYKPTELIHMIQTALALDQPQASG